MSAIQAIILDFDGVLVESNEAKTYAFEDLCDLYPAYRDMMMEYHKENYSIPRMMKFEHYVYDLMGREKDVEMVQTMACLFSEFVVRRVMACSEVVGAREFLEEFWHQVPLYISSATPQQELRQIVHARGMDSFFVKVFGNPPHKKVDVIRLVLTCRKIVPSGLMFIGDTVADYCAAMDAGVEFVGRDSGLPFDGIDIKLHRDLREIAEVVRQRLKG